jgi:divalent metal cation (Fe/Co/Zn/Cd) transporter
MLDGVDPAMVSEVYRAAEHISGVRKVLDVKARWLGHRLHAGVAILVDNALSVAEADRIGDAVRQEMLTLIPALSVANVWCRGSDRLEQGCEISGHMLHHVMPLVHPPGH